MYKRILIAIDGSELADKALLQGLQLAKALGASAVAVTVTEPWTSLLVPDASVAFPIEEYEKSAAQAADRIFAGVGRMATKCGVKCETSHVSNASPADGIVTEAETQRADLIVMASHGRRGVSRLLLGSQAAKVLALSTIPILICR